MIKFSSSLYWYSANICACLGAVSIFIGFAAIMGSDKLFEITKPLSIISFLLVFPLFFAFVLIGFASSINSFGKKDEKKKKVGELIKKSINEFFEPIKILLSIQLAHLISTLFLLISAVFIYKTHRIGGVNWNFGSPFEREHAISFGATAAVCYGIMLPFYSHESAKNALFSTEL